MEAENQFLHGFRLPDLCSDPHFLLLPSQGKAGMWSCWRISLPAPRTPLLKDNTRTCALPLHGMLCPYCTFKYMLQRAKAKNQFSSLDLECNRPNKNSMTRQPKKNDNSHGTLQGPGAGQGGKITYFPLHSTTGCVSRSSTMFC